MQLNPEKVLANARRSETEDLLDRVTVWRTEMEPAAVEIIEAELARRGITPEDIHAHHRALKHRVLRTAAGLVLRCSYCGRAAVESQPGWHRVWRLVPVFKRTFYYCDEHWQAKQARESPGKPAGDIERW